MTREEETALITQCLAGAGEAFAALVRAHQREALFHALRILRDQDEAEDAVQSAFINAWQHLGQFDTRRPFFPWLFVIVKNECLQRTRRLARMAPESQVPEEPVETDTQTAPHNLEQAMSRLSSQHREILELRHWQGRTYEMLALP